MPQHLLLWHMLKDGPVQYERIDFASCVLLIVQCLYPLGKASWHRLQAVSAFSRSQFLLPAICCIASNVADEVTLEKTTLAGGACTEV